MMSNTDSLEFGINPAMVLGDDIISPQVGVGGMMFASAPQGPPMGVGLAYDGGVTDIEAWGSPAAPLIESHLATSSSDGMSMGMDRAGSKSVKSEAESTSSGTSARISIKSEVASAASATSAPAATMGPPNTTAGLRGRRSRTNLASMAGDRIPRRASTGYLGGKGSNNGKRDSAGGIKHSSSSGSLSKRVKSDPHLVQMMNQPGLPEDTEDIVHKCAKCGCEKEFEFARVVNARSPREFELCTYRCKGCLSELQRCPFCGNLFAAHMRRHVDKCRHAPAGVGISRSMSLSSLSSAKSSHTGRLRRDPSSLSLASGPHGGGGGSGGISSPMDAPGSGSPQPPPPPPSHPSSIGRTASAEAPMSVVQASGASDAPATVGVPPLSRDDRLMAAIQRGNILRRHPDLPNPSTQRCVIVHMPNGARPMLFPPTVTIELEPGLGGATFAVSFEFASGTSSSLQYASAAPLVTGTDRDVESRFTVDTPLPPSREGTNPREIIKSTLVIHLQLSRGLVRISPNYSFEFMRVVPAGTQPPAPVPRPLGGGLSHLTHSGPPMAGLTTIPGPLARPAEPVSEEAPMEPSAPGEAVRPRDESGDAYSLGSDFAIGVTGAGDALTHGQSGFGYLLDDLDDDM